MKNFTIVTILICLGANATGFHDPKTKDFGDMWVPAKALLHCGRSNMSLLHVFKNIPTHPLK